VVELRKKGRVVLYEELRIRLRSIVRLLLILMRRNAK